MYATRDGGIIECGGSKSGILRLTEDEAIELLNALTMVLEEPAKVEWRPVEPEHLG